jgi:hypothetical protein
MRAYCWREALRILRHHRGDKILLLAPVVARIPHGMEYENPSGRDLFDVVGG